MNPFPFTAYGSAISDGGIKALLLLAPVMIALAHLSSRTQPFRFEYPLYKGANSSLWTSAVYAFSYLVFYLG